MTKKIFIMASMVMALFLTGCTTKTDTITPAEQEVTTLHYENKQSRLNIDFPSSRTFKENVFGTTVMFFSPEKEDKATKENIGITAQLISSGSTLETLYKDNIANIKAIAKDVITSEEKDIKIDNYPAKQVQYTFSQGNYKIKQEQTIVLKEDVVYIINYIATTKTFDDYLEDANNIIDSIRLR